MADDTTKLVFQLAEGICQDIDTLREDVRCAEESYRATTKSIHAVKDAVRIAEESQCNWEASMKRMNETFVSLQKSTQDMGESCRNWQESIQTNYDNTNILNKRMQSIVSSRQSSCSRTLRLSADIDRRSHAESPFGGHPNSWTPTPSQCMVTESSHSLRTESPLIESVPGGEDEARTSRAKPAANKDDVRGNVCLACLQSWEKSLNENTGRLKEGCVYNPGATDCSECIEKQRKGPQECRKILSGQSKTLRRLKREFIEVPRNRHKSPQATKFFEAVTKEIQIIENTKKRKKKKAPVADESQPTAKKSRTSRGRSKSVPASQSNIGPEVSLKMEGDASELAQ
ncbi:uncharacterized protein N7506_007480 [Penicillium brevicompactum]|uniref:uncharacterized protein n=1 Tax=Penicillium brevicompactum TaxID=5074 RepID=UPI00253FC9E2|nr:uncharacterized protein N7506_007480 [Penicillium brevicompactum]KAJ5333697.1 hypothetical protein N7506_007480 [Penicillium brevicompactum]